MKQKISLISSLGIAIALLAGLFLPAKPVFSGATVWSAEIIPSKVDNVLGPDNPGDNIDVRDFSMTENGLVIYAVAGNSITTNILYKSTDYGVTWTAINIPIVADFVAVAPDHHNIVAIANSTTPEVYVSTDGGTTWYSLGAPQEEGANPATVIFDITISEIREARNCLAVAGKEAGDIANLWYFNIGETVPTWQETRTLAGFTNGDEVRAIAFSGAYSLDSALVVISEDDGVGIYLQIIDISAEKWNASAGYLNYPRTVVADAGITGLSSASLSLAPDYVGSEDDTRTVFIGLTVLGNASAVATSGIYRFVDTTKTEISTDVQIHSVAFNGSYLVAGGYDSSIVYRCSDPSSATPTVLTASLTKYPGGENKVLVAWLNSNVVAGTCGNESAFSISVNSGLSFNDISLIDTVIVNAVDVAVSASGGTVYLVTNDGNDISLWRENSDEWQRVFSGQGTTAYIVRISPDNANYVYLAKSNGTTVYYNSSGGTTQWSVRTCNINIVDLAIESNAVAYALDAAGVVSRSTNYGFGWGIPIPTTLGSGASIVSISSGKLLVGSQNGYVAYSLDGNATWTVIPQILELGAGNVQVVADQYFSSNKVIYAASNTGGQNIKKWQIDTSAEWTDVFRGTLNGGIYGLTIDNNTLYALEYGGGQSTLWICISPTSATDTSISWSSSTTTGTTDVDDVLVQLDAAPRALKSSSGKLWAVKTNGTNKLYSFTNISISLTLLKPESGATFKVNIFTGVAYDIPFSWDRPTETTEYELDIALDPNFSSLVTTVTVPTINEIAFVLVGPGQPPGAANVNLMSGTTYYWRIRTTKPVFSGYSSSRYFFIEPINATLPGEMTPPSGQVNMSSRPAFSWAPMVGAAEYQFILSDNISMESPIIDVTVTTCGFAVTQELEHGKTYFWQVRAIRPVESDWSPLANFTVAEQPDEPVPLLTVNKRTAPVIELPEQPPETIINVAPPLKPPPPVTPDYLRIAVYIVSTLLLVVVILLLFPFITRLLPAPAVITGPLEGPSRRVRNITKKLGKAWEEIAARSRGVIPVPTRITTGEAPEIETLSFAVKSFLYMSTSGEKENGEKLLSPEEENTLGKKLAAGIRSLAAEKPLYLAFPEDAAQFLQIWSQYGSREETDRHIKKSFKGKPENAMAFLKCYLPTGESTEEGAAAKPEFTQAEYNALARVVNPENVYEPVAKLLKFRFEKEGDKGLADPLDRSIAYQFVRIHYDIKK